MDQRRLTKGSSSESRMGEFSPQRPLFGISTYVRIRGPHSGRNTHVRGQLCNYCATGRAAPRSNTVFSRELNIHQQRN